jgi:hypothetical protein
LLQAAQPGGGDDVGERERVRVVAREQLEVLAHLQRLRHLRDLQHRADAPTRGGLDRVLAEEADPTRVRARQPEQQLDRRGLAGAVGTEHRGQPAALEREIDAVQCQRVAVALRDAPQLGHRLARLERRDRRRCHVSLHGGIVRWAGNRPPVCGVTI